MKETVDTHGDIHDKDTCLREEFDGIIPAVPATEGSPVVIAGPCSAESREQTLSCAKLLSKAGIKIFRAGLWKPRTRPGCFEGCGETGLQWLAEVKETTGMLTATEVASPRHVELALASGVDILSRKPCLLTLFLLEGWKVLFILLYCFCFIIHYSECKFNCFFWINQTTSLFADKKSLP